MSLLDTITLTISLFAIFGFVLLAPFVFRKIENNLEAFLLAMGVLAATISQVWSIHLIFDALAAPIAITSAVLTAGLVFHFTRSKIRAATHRLLDRLPAELVTFLVVAAVGLSSSFISVIIASLILVEIVNILPLSRQVRVNFTIMSCFALGLGAVLTPIGEPLSTIAVSKLSEPPYNAGFFYLADLLGIYIVPGVLVFAGIGAFFVRQSQLKVDALTVEEGEKDRIREVGTRAFRVYVFVTALIFLGAGFKPLIDLYFVGIPPPALYWINIISAIVDNATLTAAEIGPALTELQIRSALMGLLISGGMLIPGNIPNIIAANKLGIKSREWARLGVPAGLVTMAVYFVILFPYH